MKGTEWFLRALFFPFFIRHSLNKAKIVRNLTRQARIIKRQKNKWSVIVCGFRLQQCLVIRFVCLFCFVFCLFVLRYNQSNIMKTNNWKCNAWVGEIYKPIALFTFINGKMIEPKILFHMENTIIWSKFTNLVIFIFGLSFLNDTSIKEFL